MIRNDKMGQDEKLKYAVVFVVILVFAFCGDWIALHFIKPMVNPHDIEFHTGNVVDYDRYQIDGFNEIHVDELDMLINNHETFYLLLSRESCYTCDIYIPTVREVFQKKGITNVYFLNRGKYNRDNELFNEIIHKYPNMQYTPYLMYFKDGIMMKELIGKKESNELIDWINS